MPIPDASISPYVAWEQKILANPLVASTLRQLFAGWLGLPRGRYGVRLNADLSVPAADGLPGDMYGFRHGRPSFHRKYPDSIAHPGENSKGRMQESPEDGAFGLSRCGEGDITSSGLSFPRSSWGPP